MPASGQWIRSIKDNPSGKVVADPEGNRREWQTGEDTARQLSKLDNDELSIEETDLRPTLRAGWRDSGGGFDPCNSDKSRSAADPSQKKKRAKPSGLARFGSLVGADGSRTPCRPS